MIGFLLTMDVSISPPPHLPSRERNKKVIIVKFLSPQKR